MKIVIECPEHLVKGFCDWFSNAGEQDYFEAHENGVFNEETLEWEQSKTYLSTTGYGLTESDPIVIHEYDRKTDEKIS